jgi:hypothetical protein
LCYPQLCAARSNLDMLDPSGLSVEVAGNGSKTKKPRGVKPPRPEIKTATSVENARGRRLPDLGD